MEKCRKEIIGDRIRQARKDLGLTQTELGEKTVHCLTYPSIYKWEQGKTAPSVEELENLCDLFECDIGYLWGDYEAKSRPAADIMEETGLTETAARALIAARDKPRELEILDAMLSSPRFWTALGSMAQFVNVFVSGLTSPCMVSDPENYTTRELDTLGLTPIWKTTAARLHLEDAAADIRAILETVAKEQVKAKNAAAIQEAAQFEELPEIEIGSPEWMQLHGDQFSPDGTSRETQSRADSQKQKKPPASSGQGQEGDIGNGEQQGN